MVDLSPFLQIAAYHRRLNPKIHYKADIMNNAYEYYDDIAEISVLTKEAIENLERTRIAVQHALRLTSGLKNCGNTVISAISTVTVNDLHRNLLFFELLLNQTLGVTNTLTFEELLELTNYLTVTAETPDE